MRPRHPVAGAAGDDAVGIKRSAIGNCCYSSASVIHAPSLHEPYLFHCYFLHVVARIVFDQNRTAEALKYRVH